MRGLQDVFPDLTKFAIVRLQQLDMLDEFADENGRKALMFFYQESEMPPPEGHNSWFFNL